MLKIPEDYLKEKGVNIEIGKKLGILVPEAWPMGIYSFTSQQEVKKDEATLIFRLFNKPEPEGILNSSFSLITNKVKKIYLDDVRVSFILNLLRYLKERNLSDIEIIFIRVSDEWTVDSPGIDPGRVKGLLTAAFGQYNNIFYFNTSNYQTTAYAFKNMLCAYGKKGVMDSIIPISDSAIKKSRLNPQQCPDEKLLTSSET
jgi:hypothetical protein